MQGMIGTLLRYRNVVLIIFLASLAVGAFAFLQLDIEAYPDPSPPMVEFITQDPSWSAEEMEQQVTVPLEAGLNGTPKLEQIRSISIFGLSDVKMYFSFDSDYFVDRQEALNRLQGVNLPNNLQPQLSPESPIGEIYRYQLAGPDHSLNDLKATQDWLVVRELKKEGSLRLAGLGIFRKRKSKARMGRNPATGEVIKISARTRLRFTAAKALKDTVLGAK